MLSVLSDVRVAALLQSLRRKHVGISERLKAATENGYTAYVLRGEKIAKGMLADLSIFEKTFRHRKTAIMDLFYGIAVTLKFKHKMGLHTIWYVLSRANTAFHVIHSQ